jgi:hypothetical protein
MCDVLAAEAIGAAAEATCVACDAVSRGHAAPNQTPCSSIPSKPCSSGGCSSGDAQKVVTALVSEGTRDSHSAVSNPRTNLTTVREPPVNQQGTGLQ